MNVSVPGTFTSNFGEIENGGFEIENSLMNPRMDATNP